MLDKGTVLNNGIFDSVAENADGRTEVQQAVSRNESDRRGQQSRGWLREGLTAVLLFGLLWEWLRPLAQFSHVTDIYWLKPILYTIASFLLLDYLRWPLALNWLAKTAVCLALIVHYYHGGPWWEMNGWRQYLEISRADVIRVFQGAWTDISAGNRTFVFLMGWAMLVYAIYTLMVFRQLAFWFVMATLLYLVGFGLLAGIDTTEGLIRSAGFGLLLLSVLRIPFLERHLHAPDIPRGWPLSWMLTSVAVVALVLAAGWFGAASHPREAREVAWDELPVFAWLEDHWIWPSGLEAARKTGYDEDDAALGGKLVEDHSVAFTAVTERVTYWRGEAKSVYTGKGWIEYAGREQPFRPEEPLPAAGRLALPAVETAKEPGADLAAEPAAEPGTDSDHISPDPFVQEIRLNTGSEVLSGMLFSGGPVARIEELRTASGETIPPDAVRYHPGSGKLSLAPQWKTAGYRLVVTEPEPKPLNERERQANLQLPFRYDERVKRLAAEVTRDAATDRQKAEAIAAYLSAEYRYSLKTTAPPAGEDFVAHFLFETRKGYCDHFSSAMVVMLRSVGVPARWVKGFAPGEIVRAGGPSGAPLWEITVRNSDAHSWVEVYLPGEGWTLFEPTPGVREHAAAQGIVQANPAASALPVSDSGEDRSVMANTAGPLVVLGQLLKEWSRSADWPELPGRTAQVVRELVPEVVPEFARSQPAFAAGGAFVLLAALILGIARLLKWRKRRLKKPERAVYGREIRDAGIRMLNRYWNKVYRVYGPRQPNQTFREYVGTLPLDPCERQVLSELARYHERYVFGGERLYRTTAKQLRTMWKQMKGS